jgi:putative ABC transport system permease protein
MKERFSTLPGVTSVSAAGAVPFSQSRWAIGRAGPEGALVDESLNQQAKYTYTFPDYFETMNIRLLEGRFFTPEEYRESIPVVVVDHLLAEAIWPGRSAVGQVLVTRPGQEDPTPFQVVGLVEHQLTESLREPGEDLFYYPFAYHPAWVNPARVTWVLRTAVPPGSLVPQVRREVEAIASDAPMTHIRTMESYMAEARAPTRFALTLITFFAVSALVLAVVGLYGVLSSSVQRRTSEIGVRVAFGAEPGSILTLVLGKGMRMVAIGIMAGMASALAFTRFMSSILVGTPPTDPETFLGVGPLFSAVAVLACWLPAWRATKVDPVRAIQVE